MILIAWAGTLLALAAHGQAFLFYNLDAPTRLGSIDGPLAGPGIWAQMLVGRTPDALAPIWMPLEHGTDGLVGGLLPVYVEGFACWEPAYVQMVAWNGVYWGTVLENVPLDQLGRTDIVRHWLTGCYGLPVFGPRFTQPAIVPPIPEPSTTLLGLLGGGLLLAGWLVRGRGKRT